MARLVFKALAGLAASTVLALPAIADTTLTYDSPGGAFKVQMQNDAVRIDDASPQWQLYTGDTNAIYSVYPERESYSELDRDAANVIRERVDEVRSRIDARVAELPESQRATARAAMLSSVPGLELSDQKVGLDRTGRTERIAGVRCEVVQVVRGGRAAESLCIADPSALGIDEATFDTVESMFSLMQTLLAGTGFQAAGLPYLDLGGMPIRFNDSRTGESRELTTISHGSLLQSLFEIPDGYRQIPVERR